ncbi:MAG TPA: FlgO family outer membrane protein [Clostridiales bacterium]|nr:FlgO family outer membrane protein [Clostridiales bacterium]HQP69192.1 FlgO family outer membrane protein [Clostridiales bacterium]
MNKIIYFLLTCIFLISCSNPEPVKNQQDQDQTIQSVKAKPVDQLILDEYLSDILRSISEEVQKDSTRTLAIITFEDVSPASKKASIGRTVTEYLYGRLAEDKSINLAERSMIDKVLQELSLNMTGLIDAENAKEAGKMIAADAILCGTVTEIGMYFDINLRIIDIEEGKILSSAVAEVKKDVFIEESTISGTDAGSIQAGLNALQVAVDLYGNMNIKDFTITYPGNLEDLVPDYIDRIPDPVRGSWIFDKSTGKVSHSEFPDMNPVNPRINNQTILNRVEKQKIISEMQSIKMSFLNEWIEMGDFPQDMGRVIKNGLRDSKPGEWIWDPNDFSVRHSKYSLPKMHLRKDGSTELVE